MNLDMLVCAGQPPWHPAPDAEDVDIWEKYDIPIRGTYRLDGNRVILSLINTVAAGPCGHMFPPPPTWRGSSKTSTSSRLRTVRGFPR